MPFELVDAAGAVVGPVAVYLRDVQACGRSEATLRSYGMDLLRWFRFCWAVGVEWDQVTRAEARDFCRWLQIAGKPGRGRRVTRRRRRRTARRCCGILRFPPRGRDRPDGEPVPAGPRPGRAPGAHHNPMEPFPRERAGLFRPRVPQRVPRSIPDEQFSELFARLGSHRDRALVAFWVSTGARAAELLGATRRGCRSGAAADHGHPQGNRRDAAASGVAGRVRLAAACTRSRCRAWSRRGRTSRCGGRCGARSGS